MLACPSWLAQATLWRELWGPEGQALWLPQAPALRTRPCHLSRRRVWIKSWTVCPAEEGRGRVGSVGARRAGWRPVLGAESQAPTEEDEQHAHADLQSQGDGDEDHQGHEEGKGGALLHHGLQLGRVGHQQRDVQHALGRALLVGVMVHVDGLVPPAPSGQLWGGDRQRAGEESGFREGSGKGDDQQEGTAGRAMASRKGLGPSPPNCVGASAALAMANVSSKCSQPS